jgi:hypothetical protein
MLASPPHVRRSFHAVFPDSYSPHPQADPARAHSRLGATLAALEQAGPDALVEAEGAMFHMNCANGDVDAYSAIVTRIGDELRPRPVAPAMGESGAGRLTLFLYHEEGLSM